MHTRRSRIVVVVIGVFLLIAAAQYLLFNVGDIGDTEKSTPAGISLVVSGL